MNLVTDSWIPVRRADGSRERIAPWQVTDGAGSNPPIAVCSERPDFDVALMQFLIGLFQVALPPRRDREWAKMFDEPPSADELKNRLEPWAVAFELLGDGPRFMQDRERFEGKEKGVGVLLLEAPGDQTLRNNSDHFIKRDQVRGLCPACVSTALMTLQINAPSGGKGHRTSVRGGGPLTTLLTADPVGEDVAGSIVPLWISAWSNVLPLEEKDFKGLNSGEPLLLPWLGDTRVSNPGGESGTTPEDVHRLQALWGMPRRIRLGVRDDELAVCDICGRTDKLIRTFVTKPYGTNYAGAWCHDLSPYRRDKDGMPICLHPGPSGIGYKDWPRFVFPNPNEPGDMPAIVVHEALANRSRYRRLGKHPQIHVSGFDMDNMKARCWYEARMPLFFLEDENRELFPVWTQGMVAAAEKAASNLVQAVRNAWFSPRPGSKGPDTGFVRRNFRLGSERKFFEFVEKLQGLSAGQGEESMPMLKDWLRFIGDLALEQFDQFVGTTCVQQEDPKRYAKARLNLIKFNKGRKMKGLLGIA